MTVTRSIFTQRRSVATNVGCFQWRLFVCVCVCLFVCQHDNFRTSKHRMMKLGGRCTVQKSRPSSNLEVITPLPNVRNSGLGPSLQNGGYHFRFSNFPFQSSLIYQCVVYAQTINICTYFNSSINPRHSKFLYY